MRCVVAGLSTLTLINVPLTAADQPEMIVTGRCDKIDLLCGTWHDKVEVYNQQIKYNTSHYSMMDIISLIISREEF